MVDYGLDMGQCPGVPRPIWLDLVDVSLVSFAQIGVWKVPFGENYMYLCL
jgi:hypothetical protein